MYFHQGVQQILQIFLPIEFQFKAPLALAVDDLDAPAKVLAQGFFTFGHVVHRKNFLFLGRGLLAHVLAQQLRLTDGQPQRNDLLRGFLLLLLRFQLQDSPGVAGG